MRDYKIKTLLVKDRGIRKDTEGVFHYSEDKLDKFERTLAKNPKNIEEFKKFKEIALSHTKVKVSKSMCYSYVGYVLENNMVINLKKDTFLKEGELVSTPKGRLKFVQLPIGPQCHMDRSVDEDLDAMTENIYDLDYSETIESLFYSNYSFQLEDGKVIIPRLVVVVPRITLKQKFQNYFYLVNDREKLEYKLKKQTDTSLRHIIEMDEALPIEFVEEHKDWTPERRVYHYVCKNPAFIHEV